MNKKNSIVDVFGMTKGNWKSSGESMNFSDTLVCYIQGGGGEENNKSLFQSRHNTENSTKDLCKADSTAVASTPQTLEALYLNVKAIEKLLYEVKPSGLWSDFQHELHVAYSKGKEALTLADREKRSWEEIKKLIEN